MQNGQRDELAVETVDQNAKGYSVATIIVGSFLQCTIIPHLLVDLRALMLCNTS